MEIISTRQFIRMYFLISFCCFTLGNTNWLNRRITFKRTQNNKLEPVIPTIATTVNPNEINIAGRMNVENVERNKTVIKIPQGSEKFSFEMLYAISDALQNYDANFVMSPLSIWSLMVLIAEGASGRTFNQLETVLHLPKDLRDFRMGYTNLQQLLSVNTSTIEVAVNQILFSDSNKPLIENYVDILHQDYRADHLQVDFLAPTKAANAINNHISYRTNGKITNIVTPEELIQMHLVLASTIFFKGQWKLPFELNETSEQPFYAENGDFIANVPMMTQQKFFRVAQIDALKASIIELPYGQDNRFSMLLIQPYSSLNAVFDSLRRYNIANIHKALSDQNQNEEDEGPVVITLPRFKIDSDLDLRTVFEYLGVTDVFSQANANLTKMSQQELYVSHVFHKAIIEVDEVGTIAAAVTVAELSFRITALEFRFNKPFGFLITDQVTNILLFGGQVRHPLV